MNRTLVTIAALFWLMPVAGSSPHKPAIPRVVQHCLSQHRGVRLDTTIRPSFLRVNFRGLTIPEYAVAVLERTGVKQRALLMVCSGTGSKVLGEAKNVPFSDMEDDAYMSSHWRKCGRSQVQALRSYYPDVPKVDYDAVCLTWEDGEALIYWDGTEFRFKSLTP